MQARAESIKLISPTSFTKEGVTYSMGEYAMVDSQAFEQMPGAEETGAAVPEYAAKGRYHKGGTNAGLRAHGIAQLVRLPGNSSGRKSKQVRDAKMVLSWT